MEARKLNSYSYEEYLDIDASLRDGERCELIFGEIVMMAGASAAHQDVVGNLLYQLKNRLKQGEKKCQARIAPFDLKLHVFTQTHVVQPDVMLFCEGKELPCAIFEVLSPTTAAKDRGVKKELYEAAGVKEYLIVDPELKIVDAYLLENGRYYYRKGFSGEEALPLECLGDSLLIPEVFEGLEAQSAPN